MTSHTKPQPTTHVIDATDRTLGRVASEVANVLLGKRSVRFAKNQALPVTVTVNNAAKMHLPARRMKGKVYVRYTGYSGGLYETSMEEMIAKKGIAEVVRRTVHGMIPRNKLRKPRMKNLIVNA